MAGRILDVGCGPGRHALWLQEQGFNVTGIDTSPGVVQVARERGCRYVQEIPVRDVNQLQGLYDSVIMRK